MFLKSPWYSAVLLCWISYIFQYFSFSLQNSNCPPSKINTTSGDPWCSLLLWVTFELKLSCSGLFQLGLENLQAKRFPRLCSGQPVPPPGSLLMVIPSAPCPTMSSQNVPFQFRAPISHPFSIWRDWFPFLKKVLLVFRKLFTLLPDFSSLVFMSPHVQ